MVGFHPQQIPQTTRGPFFSLLNWGGIWTPKDPQSMPKTPNLRRYLDVYRDMSVYFWDLYYIRPSKSLYTWSHTTWGGMNEPLYSHLLRFGWLVASNTYLLTRYDWRMATGCIWQERPFGKQVYSPSNFFLWRCRRDSKKRTPLFWLSLSFSLSLSLSQVPLRGLGTEILKMWQ